MLRTNLSNTDTLLRGRLPFLLLGCVSMKRFFAVPLLLAFACASGISIADEPQYAAISLTPTQLLQKAAEARGTMRDRAYHEIEDTVNGERTIHTDYLTDGDNSIETDIDGPFIRSFGTWHGVDWEKNTNGVVVHTTDFALTADPFRQALSSPHASSSNMRVLGVTKGADPAIVLELKPRDALLQRRYYDAKTYLLRRIETTEYDGHTKVRTYEDYAPFHGSQVARTSAYSDGRRQNDSASHVTLLEDARTTPASAFAIPASSRPFTFASNTPVEVPSTFTEDGIIVRLNVGGRGLDFVLDSGASGITIDRGTAQSLGLTLHGRNMNTIAGDVEYSQTILPDVSVGVLHAKNLAVDVVPYTEPVGDMKVVGLLGGDFFASGAVTVDFRNRRVTIAPQLASAPDGYAKLPISIDDFVPMLDATFNGKKGTFIADLGAFATMLYPHYFAQFGAPKEDEDYDGAQFIGGETKTRSYRFSHLELGDYVLEDVLVRIPSNSKVDDVDYDGLVGRDILKYFTVIFDYPNRTCYLKPFSAQ